MICCFWTLFWLFWDAKQHFLGLALSLRPSDFFPSLQAWNSQLPDLLPGDVSGCWSPRHFFATSWPCWYAAAAWRCNWWKWTWWHSDKTFFLSSTIMVDVENGGIWKVTTIIGEAHTHFSLPPWLLGGKSILITSGKFCLLQLLQVVSFHRHIVIGNGKDWIFVLERSRGGLLSSRHPLEKCHSKTFGKKRCCLYQTLTEGETWIYSKS